MAQLCRNEHLLILLHIEHKYLLCKLYLLQASPRVKRALQVAHLENNLYFVELPFKNRSSESVLHGIVFWCLLVHIIPADLGILKYVNHFLLFRPVLHFATCFKNTVEVLDGFLKFVLHNSFIALFNSIQSLLSLQEWHYLLLLVAANRHQMLLILLFKFYQPVKYRAEVATHQIAELLNQLRRVLKMLLMKLGVAFRNLIEKQLWNRHLLVKCLIGYLWPYHQYPVFEKRFSVDYWFYSLHNFRVLFFIFLLIFTLNTALLQFFQLFLKELHLDRKGRMGISVKNIEFEDQNLNQIHHFFFRLDHQINCPFLKLYRNTLPGIKGHLRSLQLIIFILRPNRIHMLAK